MLDIIIPTYKNPEGLIATLQSLDLSLIPEITLTVVDDCSNISYDKIIELFPQINILYKDKNTGPGLTRQYGIDNTKEPYIMFIDTGDIFLIKEMLKTILNTIKNNPEHVIFSWQYLTQGIISEDSNNRLHGRIYQRKFLEKYHICFCETSSYANEDIGFNRLCRLIIKDKNLKTLSFQNPIIDYVISANSLTRENNNAFFFCQQNKALALNSIHITKIAKKNNISTEALLEEVNIIMASLYYTFMCTIHARPEFSQEAWEGAKIYYDTIFSKIENSQEAIRQGYNKYIPAIFQCKRKWPKNYPINYTRFLNDLKKYSKIPYWYQNE